LSVAWAGTCACHAQTFSLYAAASLKESATEIAHAFEKHHPGVSVAINFAGSQQLAAQIRQGAPVDVLMSAGMEPLKSIDYAKPSLETFATNKLALIVPSGSTKLPSIGGLDGSLRLIVADKSVPVGHYTFELLAKAEGRFGSKWRSAVERNVISREQDVRAVLTKIELGEADAGFVYVTDVATAKGKVQRIPIPEDLNIRAVYPAVRFTGSANEGLAKEFTRYLLDREAQRILIRRGFDAPVKPQK